MIINMRYVEAVTPHKCSCSHKCSCCSSFFMLVFNFSGKCLLFGLIYYFISIVAEAVDLMSQSFVFITAEGKRIQYSHLSSHKSCAEPPRVSEPVLSGQVSQPVLQSPFPCFVPLQIKTILY